MYVYKTFKKTARGKEGHYILAKCSIQQDALTVVNICIPNNRPAKGMKQKLTELKVQNRQFYGNRLQTPTLIRG